MACSLRARRASCSAGGEARPSCSSSCSSRSSAGAGAVARPVAAGLPAARPARCARACSQSRRSAGSAGPAVSQRSCGRGRGRRFRAPRTGRAFAAGHLPRRAPWTVRHRRGVALPLRGPRGSGHRARRRHRVARGPARCQATSAAAISRRRAAGARSPASAPSWSMTVAALGGIGLQHGIVRAGSRAAGAEHRIDGGAKVGPRRALGGARQRHGPGVPLPGSLQLAHAAGEVAARRGRGRLVGEPAGVRDQLLAHALGFVARLSSAAPRAGPVPRSCAPARARAVHAARCARAGRACAIRRASGRVSARCSSSRVRRRHAASCGLGLRACASSVRRRWRVSGRAGQGNGLERIEQLPARGEVLLAGGALGRSVRGHRLIGGRERVVEAAPQGTAAGAAEAVELFPARPQPGDRFAALLDRERRSPLAGWPRHRVAASASASATTSSRATPPPQCCQPFRRA